MAGGIGDFMKSLSDTTKNILEKVLEDSKAGNIVHLFRDKVGKEITQNIARGMESGKKEVKKSTDAIIDEIAGTSQRAEQLGTSLGTRLMQSFGAAIFKEDKNRLLVFQNFLDNLDRQLELHVISEETYYNELDRIRNRYLTKGSKEWYDYGIEVFQYESKVFESHKEHLATLYDEILNYAQGRTDALNKMRQDLEDNLNDYGELFSIANYKHSDGSSQNVLFLSDIKQTNENLTRYTENLLRVQDRIREFGFGETDVKGFFSELIKEDIGDALFYTDVLVGLDDERFLQQIEGWKTSRELAKTFATVLYQDTAEQVEEEIKNFGFDKVGEYIVEQMNQAGLEIPDGFFKSGVESALEFERGFSPYFEKIVAEAVSLLEHITLDFSPVFQVPDSLSAGDVVHNNYNTNNYTINETGAGSTLQDIQNWNAIERQLTGGTDI